MKKLYFVHESSFIDEDVKIGENTKVWHFCHISKGAKIGKNCIIGQNVFIGNNVNIGDNVKIQNNVSVYENVEIKKNVFCGPSVVFTNVKTPRSFISRKNEYLKTVVCEGVSLGANATILCGIKVGEFCMVGAGALITKECIPHSLMIGVPAYQKGWVSYSGEILDESLICPRDKIKYFIKNNRLKEK